MNLEKFVFGEKKGKINEDSKFNSYQKPIKINNDAKENDILVKNILVGFD